MINQACFSCSQLESPSSLLLSLSLYFTHTHTHTVLSFHFETNTYTPFHHFKPAGLVADKKIDFSTSLKTSLHLTSPAFLCNFLSTLSRRLSTTSTRRRSAVENVPNLLCSGPESRAGSPVLWQWWTCYHSASLLRSPSRRPTTTTSA